jgi:hypothetical protein
MKVHHEEMMAIFGDDRGETKAYPEKTEANLEETELKAEHWEALENMLQWKLSKCQIKWYRGPNLAIECHQKPKERTWVNCGFQMKLAAVCKGTTYCGKVAQSEGNVVGENWTRDKVVRGILKGWTLGRRQGAQQEFNRGIRK